MKYVSNDSNSQSESSPKESKPKTASLPKKQIKKLSQNKKIINKLRTEGFRILNVKIMCYF